MKLSDKRKMSIYSAVSDRLVDLRLEVNDLMISMGEDINGKLGTKLDTMIARAQGEAAHNAVKAAEEETMKKEYPPVQIGQVYKDRDKRRPERHLRVEDFGYSRRFAFCVECTPGGYAKGKRNIRISLERLQTRFTLIGE